MGKQEESANDPVEPRRNHYVVLPLLALVLLIVGWFLPWNKDALFPPYLFGFGVVLTLLAIGFGGRMAPSNPPGSNREPSGPSAAQEPKPPQFTIARLLLAMAVVGMFMGLVVNYGGYLAILWSLFAAIPLLLAIHVLRYWRTGTPAHRWYMALTTASLAMLLVAFTISMGADPWIEGEHSLRLLQRSLSTDSRFSSLHVEIDEIKGRSLVVHGHVASQNDFDALQKTVSSYRLHEVDRVEWDVTIDSLESKDAGDLR